MEACSLRSQPRKRKTKKRLGGRNKRGNEVKILDKDERQEEESPPSLPSDRN